MIYKTVSIENLIGRIVRNTQLSDMSAIQNAYEWIPEAMEQLETQSELESVSMPGCVKDYQLKLPCGLSYIEGILYEGGRLNYSDSLYNTRAESNHNTTTVFQSVPGIFTNPATGNNILGWTMEQVKQVPLNGEDYYFLKPNYLCTSFKEGDIVLFYKRVVLDANGFPMIPDNGNYKEAVYWYVRGKLIGSGLLTDKNQSEDSCTAKFEMYGRRAINEITYPSIDKMEMIRVNNISFNISENYWSNFNRA